MRRLRDQHPGCEIRLSEVPEDPQIGDLDLLFYDGPVDGDVEHVKLVDDPYLLAARPGDLPDGALTAAAVADRLPGDARQLQARWDSVINRRVVLQVLALVALCVGLASA